MKHRESNYVKQAQKDYSLSFKLQVIQELEQGLSTRTQALDKYGIQSRSTIRTWLKKYDYDFSLNQSMSKTLEQRILELEQQVKLLEKQKARAEFLAERADKKAIIFDMMIDIAEQEFAINKYDTSIEIKTQLIKNAINIYNQKRPHLSNSMLTPNQMHQQNKLKRKSYKKQKVVILNYYLVFIIVTLFQDVTVF